MSQGKPKNKSHWDSSHPGEVARDRLRKEIKAGRITRPDVCQLCAAPSSSIIAHHWRGYAYPLDVWWICPSCNTNKTLAHDGSQTLDEARTLMAQHHGKQKHQQIDNSHLEAKLDLRRFLLTKYHSEQPPHVLDCCQGSGIIWQQLKQEFEVASYWGVDVKKKSGRVTLDSRRLLKTPGWKQNVIDVDTYGSPWQHWLALLPNVTKPTTVFLTIGDQNSVVLQASGTGGDLIGLPESTPGSLCGMVGRRIAANILLTRAISRCTIADSLEAETSGASARYLGVHLIPHGQAS